MSRFLVPALAVVCAAVSFPLAGHAQPAGAVAAAPELAVRNVRFSYPRVEGSQSPVMEVEVELDVRGPGAAGRNPRFVDNVRVALMLAVQARGRTAGDFEYYHAEAEAVTLEAGMRVMRFFLPAEIVRRDGLSGDAFAYYVEIAVGGRVLAPLRGNLSETLRERERFEVFRQKVADARTATDGILLPQHLFLTGLTDRRETPAVIRKAAR